MVKKKIGGKLFRLTVKSPSKKIINSNKKGAKKRGELVRVERTNDGRWALYQRKNK